MIQRPYRRLALAATLLFAFSSLVACGDQATQEEEQEEEVTASELEFSVAENEPSDDGVELPVGEPLEDASREEREARVVLFKGILDGNNIEQPYSIELHEVLDAEVYRDVDDAEEDVTDSEHWVTVAEVVDESGEVIWRDRVNSLFQVFTYLQTVMKKLASLDLPINFLYGFAEDNYPDLLNFGVKVPVGLENGHTYRLKVPHPNEEGEMLVLGEFEIDEILEKAEPTPVEAEAETFVDNGAPSERIDVVILADGYTDAEKEKFQNDAQKVADRFLDTPPLSDHSEMFNFHTVWTPSAESGAGYDCPGADDCKDDFRDTFFGNIFIVSAMIDQFNLDLPASTSRVAMPLQIARIYEAAVHKPFDEIIMLSNTDRRSGFAGLYFSVLTTFDDGENFPDVAVHEFGHSFGVLGDEYQVQGDACLYTEDLPLPHNIAHHPDDEELPWSEWVAPQTPLPTPESERDEVEVGAYEGAYNCDFLYRPSHTCKMKYSSDSFCSVCSEQMVRRIYSFVDLVPSGFPKVERVDASRIDFDLGVRSESYDVSWNLGDTEIDSEANLDLRLDDVPEEWTRLTATVTEGSGYVQTDDSRLQETYEWWVRSNR